VLDATGQDEATRIATEIAAAVEAGRRRPRDFAILFRTAALSRSLEIALRTAGVPYQLVRGLEFFKRREIRDVVAWLRLLRNPRDDEAFLRVVNVPARGIGRQSLERLAAWAEDHATSRLAAAAAADRIAGLPKRAARELAAFARLHADLGDTAGRQAAVAELLTGIIEQTGYRRMLEQEADDDEGGLERLANVEELVTAARQYDEAFAADPAIAGEDADALGGFLETTALVADADAWDPGADRTALMTFHAAKGLEFPVVYLVAMEDGILPHERSLDRPEQLEEERRLVFVGITRAREELHASSGRMRDYRGTRRISAPSLFLAEMTGSETVVTGVEAPAGGDLPVFDPFGDAARAAADEFAEFVHESPAESPQLRVFRPDGLTLDAVDSQDDRPPPPQRARRRQAAVERATDLATWAMQQAGVAPVAGEFAVGQRVRHAEYGAGVLVKISGVGVRSVGTVTFDGPAGTRKFILGHGALEPAE
jgi:DNA helicase-2/ATP-dependent DNA helicase PcrA